MNHPTCDNVAKTWYYFERCEALGVLERAINTLFIQPVETKDRVNAATTLRICSNKIVNEITHYAATHKEDYGN